MKNNYSWLTLDVVSNCDLTGRIPFDGHQSECTPDGIVGKSIKAHHEGIELRRPSHEAEQGLYICDNKQTDQRFLTYLSAMCR